MTVTITCNANCKELVMHLTRKCHCQQAFRMKIKIIKEIQREKKKELRRFFADIVNFEKHVYCLMIDNQTLNTVESCSLAMAIGNEIQNMKAANNALLLTYSEA